MNAYYWYNALNMKKIIISAVFILGFVTYVFYNRATTNVAASAAPITTSISSATAVPASGSPVAGTAATPVTTGTSPVTTVPKATGQYADGTYTGSIADAYYGNIEVAAVISGGKLADVTILQYPNDRHESVSINQRALPTLTSEAIKAQSANVSGVSGASDTSTAFKQSLVAALSKASG